MRRLSIMHTLGHSLGERSAAISCSVRSDHTELARRAAWNYPAKMKSRGFTFWQDGDAWLGYLDEFPDYLTQGDSLEDLKAHLVSLYQDLVSGEIPSVRQHGQLEIA